MCTINFVSKTSLVFEKLDCCIICVEPLHNNDLQHCGHWVHTQCIIQSGKPQCPFCRVNIDLDFIDTLLCRSYELELKQYLDDEFDEFDEISKYIFFMSNLNISNISNILVYF